MYRDAKDRLLLDRGAAFGVNLTTNPMTCLVPGAVGVFRSRILRSGEKK